MSKVPADRPVEASGDAYVAYIHRFFQAWLPVYDWFARSIFWVYRETVKRCGARPGVRVLDVCAGTGEIAIRCARQGSEVTAIDVTAAMLFKGRLKASRDSRARSVRFEIMDARSLAFPDRSFDVSVISFALHDMPRRVRLQVLGEALRVTRDRLVIADYDLPRGAIARRAAAWCISLFETAYFRSFAVEGVSPLLVESGIATDPGISVRVDRLAPGIFSVYEIERV